MKKSMKKSPRKLNSVIREEWKLNSADRREMRKFPRSVLDIREENVFYFSIGGAVMPLSCNF